MDVTWPNNGGRWGMSGWRWRRWSVQAGEDP
ncbi:hypothetical protein Q604_UNBC00988G0001, partial [human gut metagenome]